MIKHVILYLDLPSSVASLHPKKKVRSTMQIVSLDVPSASSLFCSLKLFISTFTSLPTEHSWYPMVSFLTALPCLSCYAQPETLTAAYQEKACQRNLIQSLQYLRAGVVRYFLVRLAVSTSPLSSFQVVPVPGIFSHPRQGTSGPEKNNQLTLTLERLTESHVCVVIC